MEVVREHCTKRRKWHDNE